MHLRKIIIVIMLIIFGSAAVGCGSKMDRLRLQQAKEALDQGNAKAAIGNTKAVLKTSPRNFMAKRLLKKIESRLLSDAKEKLDAKDYAQATTLAETVLDEINPQSEEAIAIRAEAKKHLLFAQASASLEKNPIVALKLVQEALKLDPQFQEAKELEETANEKVQERLANLMTTAKQLIAEEKFEELIELAQEVLTIEPNNKEASDLLKDSLAKKLARDQKENLELARKFYAEGIYPSALAKAELVLKGNPNNVEAKQLVEKSKAEMNRPKLRLTGFTKIKGMLFAQIVTPDSPRPIRVMEGEEFGDFRVSAIDYDLKAVVVTYLKTGTQHSLTLGED